MWGQELATKGHAFQLGGHEVTAADEDSRGRSIKEKNLLERRGSQVQKAGSAADPGTAYTEEP